MKFRYYITDTFDGLIRGTNDLEKAKNYALCEEYFVVDTESGDWLCAEGKTLPIEEVK